MLLRLQSIECQQVVFLGGTVCPDLLYMWAAIAEAAVHYEMPTYVPYAVEVRSGCISGLTVYTRLYTCCTLGE